ncbi:MAG: hypothetical protein OQL19_03930 [Gammaproteobacteria bacterium]|nr:hypothetical protein [Gammaproteobacteria bacterium]
MKHSKWVKVLTMGAVIALSGCGSEPEWVSIYEECKEKMNEGMAEMKQSKDTPQAMNDMMKTMGMTACEMIKSTCENDPDGAMCTAIVNSHNEKK